MKVDEVLKNLAPIIADLESQKNGWNKQPKVRCRDVCSQLGIFDWFPETLSISRLKDMQRFLLEAKKLGFNGYCCFKVGEEGTASGKWAYTEDTTDGYSPRNCPCVFESFYANKNYWQVSKDSNTFYPSGANFKSITTLKGVEKVWKEVLWG